MRAAHRPRGQAGWAISLGGTSFWPPLGALVAAATRETLRYVLRVFSVGRCKELFCALASLLRPSLPLQPSTPNALVPATHDKQERGSFRSDVHHKHPTPLAFVPESTPERNNALAYRERIQCRCETNALLPIVRPLPVRPPARPAVRTAAGRQRQLGLLTYASVTYLQQAAPAQSNAHNNCSELRVGPGRLAGQ